MDKGYIKPGELTEDVDYFEPRLETPEWTREELQGLRSRWFWRYNLGLLFRHPLRFFSRYLVFMARPGLLVEVIKRRLRA